MTDANGQRGPGDAGLARIEDPLELFLQSQDGEQGQAQRQQPLFTTHIEDSTEKLHHDGSFGAYMDLKKRKLDEQFADGTALPVTDDPALRNLFKGVSIHVNGLTDPSHAELRRLMYMYGGSFQNYYHRRTVTHIICSNLPDAKVKAFEKEKNPTPFIRPQWITESIQARKLLPIGAYVLERTRTGGPGQQTLDFGRVVDGRRTATGTVSVINNNKSSRGVPSNESTKIRDRFDSANVNQTMSRRERLARAQVVAKQMRDECKLLKGPPKSSRDDPNFVESFYRASRLHFIGTWKTRLENLMQSDVVDSPTPMPSSAIHDRTIVHVDMDCFFASVAEASHPEFRGLPVAVCHSNAMGSGEISSANYEARKSGIHASMFMARAKELCPELIVVPYEFEKYELVSETVFRIFLRYTSAVQAISCDEAYLDVTGLGDPMEIVGRMRRDIESETSCPASAGIGPNMLLARLATAKAKPNGQYHLKVDNALGELACLDVQELPGIGWRTGERLRTAGFHQVLDIQNSSKAVLQNIIGDKLGALAYDYAFGHDERLLIPSTGLGTDRKSVGAEVNWGVRFDSDADSESFLMSIAQQVSDRLTHLGMRASSITLKIKKRRQGAQEPRKFLGMGICDSITRSKAVDRVQSATAIFEHALPLLRSLCIPFADIRGVGLSVTKLDKADGTCKTPPTKTKPASDAIRLRDGKNTGRIDTFAKPLARRNEEAAQARLKVHPAYRLQPSEIDASVLEELPADIQLEIRREYGLLHADDPPKAALRAKPQARPIIAPIFAIRKPKKSMASNNKSSFTTKQLLTEYDPMRMSQVDVDVLRELPMSLQQEVAKSLEAYGRGFKRKKLEYPPKTTAASTTEASEAKLLVRREMDRHLDSLHPALGPSLHSAIISLHDGSSVGFVSKLETWIQASLQDGVADRDDADEIDDKIGKLALLVVAEIESPVSLIDATTAWSLVRGLSRLGNAYGGTSLAIGSLAEAAAEVVARKHNIIVDT